MDLAVTGEAASFSKGACPVEITSPSTVTTLDLKVLAVAAKIKRLISQSLSDLASQLASALIFVRTSRRQAFTHLPWCRTRDRNFLEIVCYK